MSQTMQGLPGQRKDLDFHSEGAGKPLSSSEQKHANCDVSEHNCSFLY
jgi:hypothetical protein